MAAAAAPPASAGTQITGTTPSGTPHRLTITRTLGRRTSLCTPGPVVARTFSTSTSQSFRALLTVASQWDSLPPSPHVLSLAAVLPDSSAHTVTLVSPYAPGGALTYRASRSPRAAARLVAAIAAGLEALYSAGICPHGSVSLRAVVLDSRGAPRLAPVGPAGVAPRDATEAEDVRGLARILYELVVGRPWAGGRRLPKQFPGPDMMRHLLELVLADGSRPMKLVHFRYELAAVRGLVPNCEPALPAKVGEGEVRKLAFLEEDLNSIAGGVADAVITDRDNGGGGGRGSGGGASDGTGGSDGGGFPGMPAARRVKVRNSSIVAPVVSEIDSSDAGRSSKRSTTNPGESSSGAGPSSEPTGPSGPEHAARLLRVTDEALAPPSLEDVNWLVAFAETEPASRRAVFSLLFKRPVGKKPVVALKTVGLLHALLAPSIDFAVLTVANDGFLSWIEAEWTVEKMQGKQGRREYSEFFRATADPSVYANLVRRKAAFHREFATAFSPEWIALPSLETCLALREAQAFSSVVDIATTAAALLETFVSASGAAVPLKGAFVFRIASELRGAVDAAGNILSKMPAGSSRDAAQVGLRRVVASSKRALELANGARGKLGIPDDVLLGSSPVTSARGNVEENGDSRQRVGKEKKDGKKEKKTKRKKEKSEKRTDRKTSRSESEGEANVVNATAGDLDMSAEDDDSDLDVDQVIDVRPQKNGMVASATRVPRERTERTERTTRLHSEESEPFVAVKAKKQGPANVSTATHAIGRGLGSRPGPEKENQDTGGGTRHARGRLPENSARRHDVGRYEDSEGDSLSSSSSGEEETRSSSRKRGKDDSSRNTKSSSSTRRSEKSSRERVSSDESESRVSGGRKARKEEKRKAKRKTSAAHSRPHKRNDSDASTSSDGSEHSSSDSESSNDDGSRRSRRRKPKKGSAKSTVRRTRENRTYGDSEKSRSHKAMSSSPPGRSKASSPSTPKEEPRGSAAALAAAASGRKTPQMDKRFEIMPHEVHFGEQVGSGGFGVVFRGKFRGSTVAIKKIHPSALSNAASIAEFQSEVAVLCTLDHPNILKFMAACVKPPNLMIVTEFMGRGTLFDVLHQSTMKVTWAMRRRMGLDICKGMRYLHDSKLLHRDLKSSNIMLDDNFKCAIGDFGLTRISQGAVAAQMTGQCGTFQYMAPEILSSKPYSEKADVFSFGIMLWELVARKLPFFGMQPMQVGIAVSQQGLRPTIPPKCPGPLEKLMRACWDEKPNKRPSFEQIQLILEAMPDS